MCSRVCLHPFWSNNQTWFTLIRPCSQRQGFGFGFVVSFLLRSPSEPKNDLKTQNLAVINCRFVHLTFDLKKDAQARATVRVEESVCRSRIVKPFDWTGGRGTSKHTNYYHYSACLSSRSFISSSRTGAACAHFGVTDNIRRHRRHAHSRGPSSIIFSTQITVSLRTLGFPEPDSLLPID